MAAYLVTGGCGFIGSHLADGLVADGHRVRILDDLSTGRLENAPREAELLRGSIVDPDLVQRAMAGMDGCFHLAAVASVTRSIEDWAGAHRVNLTGAIDVFDAARRAASPPVPVVYASSAAVYGDVGEAPVGEAAPTRPLSAYGADKRGCELHAHAGGGVHGLPTFGLRFFNVYGPRQDPASPYSGVISIFLGRIARHQPLTIHGDGEQRRDFVHVGDVVRCMRIAFAHAAPAAPVVNVCTGIGTSIIELATMMTRLAGGDLPIQRGPARAGDARCSIGDPSGAHRQLGWRAEIGLADGLRRMLAAPPQTLGTT